MTTIAYKNGVIAYDSRATREGVIVTDKADKMLVRDGTHFFLCGSTCDFERFVSLWFDRDSERFKGIDCGGFVYCKDGLFQAGVCEEDGPYRAKIEPERIDAVGSGAHFAMAAMDMGATAEEAVKIAMMRDTGTGGKVNVFTLAHGGV